LLKQYQTTVDDLPEAIVMYEPPVDLKARILARAAASADGVQAGRKVAARPAKWNLAALLPGISPAWGAIGLALIVLLAASTALLWARLERLENASMLRTIALQGAAAAPQAQGILVISVDGQHGTLVVDGMPLLDPTRQYQLWLIHDGQRSSGGVFSVSRDGYGSLWVDSPAPLASYQRVGITIEPAGGSPGPTGDKVLGGDL
jgi:anti-sigma-K factor RskA